MIFFFGYFLLATALAVAVWVLKAHLFRATQTSAVHENQTQVNDTIFENINDHNESKNVHLNPKEKDMSYESANRLNNRFSGTFSNESNKSDNTMYETIDNYSKTNETMTNTSLQLETRNKHSEVSTSTECEDESVEKYYEEPKNIKNITAYTLYKSHILDGVNSISSSRTNVTSCPSFFEDKLNNSATYYDIQTTNEPTEVDYKSPEVIRQTYFTQRKYNAIKFTSNQSNYCNENAQSFTDIIEQDDSSSNDEVKNYLNATGHRSTEISDERIKETLDPNTSSSDCTEPFASTISSSDNSINDIKYVEDITGIMFCQADKSNNLNDAFIGE